jgi:hypothetical protein
MNMNQYMSMQRKESLRVRQSFIVNGEISEIKIKNIVGAQPLNGKDLKDFEIFLEKYAEKIVEKWISYFVYHKNVEFEKSQRG